MKSKYKFISRKGRAIQVSFAHIPGRWFSTQTHNHTEAVLWAERKLKEDLGSTVTKKDVTLKEFATGFFSEDSQGYRKRNEKRKKFYSDHYYKAHQGRLDNYIIPRFGMFLLSAISDVMIEDWFVELVSHTNGTELSDDSKNKVLFCFRMVLQEAKRQRYIKDNPALNVKEITAEHVRRDPFTDIELFKMFPRNEQDLLRIWGSRMWAAYFLVMRDTGFRPGEVAALSPSNISEKYQGVYTERSIDYRTAAVKDRIKTSDKGFKYKVGLLSDQAMKQIHKLLDDAPIAGNDLLFQVKQGRPIIPDTANKHLRLSMSRAGILLNGRTQYSLRHSFETHLAGNVDQKILLELMAHTSFRKEYDHRTPEDILNQLQPAREVIEKRS
ncbi:MAG: site-specific integrase [Spirochaetia bacterium]|nr:site-specific integrase [Spirochaetia bacterium]